MNIQIKQISIINFKGIKQLFVNFNEKTSIFGANGTGKTTIYDAFCWLLFGKNAEDRKDFNIKNTVEVSLNRQEHEVSAIINVDGSETSLKRVYKEKWTKKKGSEEAEYTGNETLYFWNEVPLQQKDFQDKIGQILNENTFKLLTNPMHFNALKWQDRRVILTSLVKSISDDEIAIGNKDFQSLVSQLQNKSLEEFKKEIAAKKKLLKDSLAQIPSRIDELLRSISGQDFHGIENALKAKEAELAVIEEAMQNILQQRQENQNVVMAKNDELFQLKLRLNNARNVFTTAQNNKGIEKQTAINVLKKDIVESENWLTGYHKEVKQLNAENEINNGRILELREKWNKENEKELVFDENQFTCPTCKRVHDADDVEAKKAEMTENFNTNKTKELQYINEVGLGTRGKIEANDQRILEVKIEIGTLEVSIDNLKKQLAELQAIPQEQDTHAFESTPEFNSISDLIKAKEREISDLLSKSDTEISAESLQRKRNTADEIDRLKGLIIKRDSEKKTHARIEELKADEKKDSQELSQLEKQEFIIQSFVKARISSIEDAINSKFQTITFKMFEIQVNGGESECCETLVNGVPWADANTGSKVAAGLEIINVLGGHYQVTAPIFLDNRESTTKVPSTESQTINLFVSPDDTVLRVA